MKKKIIFDVILNMLATLIPMFALQFIILPQVALKISADSYGQLLAIIAFMYLSASSFGSVLNNSKLIHYKRYDELKIQGDFNIILVIFLVSNAIIMILGLLYYGKSLNVLTNISLVLISSILLFNTYASVEFRIKLNFKNILMNSIMLFFGYLIGFALFLFTGYWSLIYLCGLGLNILFLIYKTSIWRENYSKTPLFRSTFKEVIMLLGSGILVSLGAYVDKLIIFPLLGGAAVSIYYAATILGKTIALAIGPITGVLLSYLAHMKKFSSNNFKFLLLISSIIGFIGYWSVILVSEPLLSLIYPQYVEDAIQYIPVTTLSIILTIISSVINPVLLKFSSAKWQMFINGLYMLIYVPLSMYLLSLHGLMGLCIGILIANFIKLLTMITTYFYVNRSTNANNLSEEY
jgi:O-antigen/teichoic acid export membrane protein